MFEAMISISHRRSYLIQEINTKRTAWSVKSKTIYHAQYLKKMAQPCKQLRLLCLPHPRNLPGELWITFSKTSLYIESFIWNNGPVNIRNGIKAQE